MSHELGRELFLYFDGLCDPNPGGVACYGWLIKREGKMIASGKGCVSKNSTNNVAEYSALGFGLKWLLEQKWDGVLKIYGDSKLVVEQVNDKWACNKEHLQKLRARCWEILNQLGFWRIDWHPREQNEEADALSRQAFIDEMGFPPPERRRKK